MSVEIFKELYEKCISIAKTKGYDPNSYDYTYLELEDGQPMIVFVDCCYDESDDRSSVYLMEEDFKLPLDDLVAKHRKEEEERARKAALAQKEWENKQKVIKEENDLKEYERLKKKYGA